MPTEPPPADGARPQAGGAPRRSGGRPPAGTRDGSGPPAGGAAAQPGGAAREGGAAGGAPAGADLARQVLAQARQDARVRGAGDARATRSRIRAAGREAAREETRDTPPPRERLPGIAAPGREWAEPMSFEAAVDRLLGDRGWREHARASAVLARWDQLVGPEIATRCQPVSLRDGELVLAAESTAWATQLRLLSRQLIAKLRAELGDDTVTKVVVRGPTAPNWQHGRLRTQGGRGPRDTYG